MCARMTVLDKISMKVPKIPVVLTQKAMKLPKITGDSCSVRSEIQYPELREPWCLMARAAPNYDRKPPQNYFK